MKHTIVATLMLLAAGMFAQQQRIQQFTPPESVEGSYLLVYWEPEEGLHFVGMPEDMRPVRLAARFFVKAEDAVAFLNSNPLVSKVIESQKSSRMGQEYVTALYDLKEAKKLALEFKTEEKVEPVREITVEKRWTDKWFELK